MPDVAHWTPAQSEEIAYHKRFYKRGNWLFGVTYCGVPISKNPLDTWVLQEVIWETQPQVIVETGTWSGGSALFMAHMLDKLWGGSGRPYEVITIDNLGLETFYRNEPAVMQHVQKVKHPRVSFVVSESQDPECVAAVTQRIADGKYERVMVILDSDHHAPHVLDELEAYGPLVTQGCYLIVEDTNIAFLDLSDWEGDGPAEAIAQWLPNHPEFAIDRTREKFGLSWHPGGWLKRVE